MKDELAAPTKRGWAEFSWLDRESVCWEGIEEESYREKWEGMREAARGPDRAEKGDWKEAHPLLETGEKSKSVVLPELELDAGVAVEAEQRS